MPTRSDFTEAEAMFRAAAALIGQVATGAQATDAGGILLGGSLSRQVPDELASCAASAANCQDAILEVAETCRQRAGLIAAYERALAIYEAAYDAYLYELDAWDRAYDSWYYSEGALPHPGPTPVPPPRPADPPAWADVRRV